MSSWSSIAAYCSLAALLGSCGSHVNLPSYGVVPDFVLTAQDGHEFHGSMLKGSVWVADFIFTNCPGPCPRMTSHMRHIQDATSGIPSVKLVSFSVDPKRDTPPVLAAYARRFHAQESRWYFLTGSIPTLHQLGRDVFRLNDVTGDSDNIDHSSRIALVDQQGRIRGFYGTSEAGNIETLIADIQSLVKESS